MKQKEFQQFLQGFTSLTSLTYLEVILSTLGGMNDGWLKVLGIALSRLTNLLTLRLMLPRSSTLTKEGIGYISSGLKGLCHLKTLCFNLLQSIDITIEEKEEFCKGLKDVNVFYY